MRQFGRLIKNLRICFLLTVDAERCGCNQGYDQRYIDSSFVLSQVSHIHSYRTFQFRKVKIKSEASFSVVRVFAPLRPEIRGSTGNKLKLGRQAWH